MIYKSRISQLSFLIWFQLLIQLTTELQHRFSYNFVTSFPIATAANAMLLRSKHQSTTRSTGRQPPHAIPTITALPSSDIATSIDPSEASSSSVPSPKKGTLYDVPVSNNGARCRLILNIKGIGPDEVLIQPPSVLGGLTSATYRSLNPQGKMPLFVCTDQNKIDNENYDCDNGSINTGTGTTGKATTGTGSTDTALLNIFESDTIARYLLHEYEHIGPSFQPNNVRSNLMVRIHDMYITTIQGCLYKAKPPFGIYDTRIDALHELIRQLQIIEDLMVPNHVNTNGMCDYLCGNEVSLSDATIYPTMVFASYMLPKFDMEVPQKLNDWYDQITKLDADFYNIQQEIHNTLDVWDTSNHRWDTILGAGWRDVEPTTIFDQIIAGNIPAAIVAQSDDKVLAFRDINPIAPAHVLLIPKHRNGLTQLSKATSEHAEILGRLLVAAASIARDESIGFGPNGSRIVINDGPDGGQEVMHLHLHLLGGRPMSWPPG